MTEPVRVGAGEVPTSARPTGSAAHRLLLIAADRIDACEADAASPPSTQPDNPITETGVRAQFSHNGLRARLSCSQASIPRRQAASQTNPSGSVKDAGPAMTIRCDPEPSAATPASLAAARRV